MGNMIIPKVQRVKGEIIPKVQRVAGDSICMVLFAILGAVIILAEVRYQSRMALRRFRASQKYRASF